MGLGASLTSFTAGTVISSSAVNADFAALNNAANPSFTGLTVSGASSLDGGKITTDGVGTLTPTILGVKPAAVPASTTSYLYAAVSGNAVGRAALGINSNGSGNLRLGNNGTSFAVELTTDGTTLLLNGTAVPITGTHSAGQPKLSYGTGVPAALDVNEVYFQIS